jgi:hypothetical protein
LGLARELEVIDRDTKSKLCMLELVEATEEQLTAAERGQKVIDGGRRVAIIQVRGLAGCRTVASRCDSY